MIQRKREWYRERESDTEKEKVIQRKREEYRERESDTEKERVIQRKRECLNLRKRI